MAKLTGAMRKDAELIVGTCMTVQKGDVVTIICDDAHLRQANAVAQLCVEAGAFPVLMNNEAQVSRGIMDTRFPMAPPRNLHQAMVNSDEIIIITNLEWANRFAHVSAVKESCAHNAKIASVEEGMGRWKLKPRDIEVATQRARVAIKALEGKNRVRVTSKKGTDVTICIEGRPALEVTPIKKRGQMMGPIPLWAEVAFAAVEDKTEGTIVVDGVMLGIGLRGQVKSPITWTLKGGRAVDIKGGKEAEKLKKVLEGVPNSTVIGEFAFGTSMASPFGSPSEKGRLGTVHFALGDNHNAYPGGKNVCDLHLDGVVLNASMEIVDNGQKILQDGKWVL